MAQLTATLDTQKGGKPIVQGDKAAPGFLQGLAGFANDWLQGLPGREADVARKVKAQGESALDSLDMAVSSELKAAGDRLKRTKAAVDQGRLTPAALEVNVEAVFDEWSSRHPEFRAEGAKYLKELGYDHWRFRELEMASKAQEARATAEVQAETNYLDAAQKAGVYDPNKTFEENMAAGREVILADRELEQRKAMAAETRAQSSETRAQSDFEKKRQDEEIFGALNRRLGLTINGRYSQLLNFINASVGDVDREKRITESLPQINTWLESIRVEAKASLGADASSSLITQVDGMIDQYKKSVEDIFTGKLSDYQTSSRTIQAMEQEYKLKAHEALPAYSMAVSMWGREAANAILGNTDGSPIPPDMREKIAAELRGFKADDATEGRVSLMNIARLLRGETNIRELPEAEAIKLMPAMASTVKATSRAILTDKKTDPQTLSTWGNAYGNILTAIAEVQPGQGKAGSVWTGAQYAFSDGSRQIIDTMRKDPNTSELGDVLLQGSRGAAMQSIFVARAVPSRIDAERGQTVVWNSNTGQYELKFDERKFAQWAAKQKSSSNLSGGANARFGGMDYKGGVNISDARRFNSEDVARISTLNAAIRFLVKTAKDDPTLPKGVTERQLYDHYRRGTPLVTASGKPMLSTDQEFFSLMDKYEADLRRDTVANAEAAANPKPPSPITNIKFSSDADAIARTIILEAANEPVQGKRAVADTIVNRIRSGRWGDSAESVVLANNGRTWQFEPWGTRASEGLRIDPDSPEYQEAYKLAQDALTGGPKSPFMNFLNKDVVVQRGHKIPDWAAGPGTRIGRHTFF